MRVFTILVLLAVSACGVRGDLVRPETLKAEQDRKAAERARRLTEEQGDTGPRSLQTTPPVATPTPAM